MANKELIKPFGRATLKELVEESRRLREQAGETRKRLADLDKAIDQRRREEAANDAPPPIDLP